MPIPEAVRKEVHLLPSILSADFSRLGEEVRGVMDAGARIIHVDIMDGHFVPNITVGPHVLEALAAQVHGHSGFFSVHLMVERPEKFIERFEALEEWEKTQVLSSLQRVATMMDAESIDAAPMLDIDPPDQGRVQ